MSKKHVIFFLVLLFIPQVSANYIMIGDDSNNLSTFVFGGFYQRIEVASTDVLFYDIIRFYIADEGMNQTLVLVDGIPEVKGKDYRIEEFSIASCSNAFSNSEFKNNLSLKAWKDACNENYVEFGDIDPERIVYYLNLTELHNKGDETYDMNVVQVVIAYSVNNYIVSNYEDIKLLWIDKPSTSQVHVPLHDNSHQFVILPNGGILESRDSFNPYSYLDGNKLSLWIVNPSQDNLIVFRNYLEEKSARRIRDFALLFASFSFTLVGIYIDRVYNVKSNLWRFIFIICSLFLIIFAFLVLRELFNYAIIVLFFILLFFLFLLFDPIKKRIISNRSYIG